MIRLKYLATALLTTSLIATCYGQNISYSELSPMPEPVTNNAVTGATVNGIPHVFSFAGMDSTKACGAAHLRSYKYNAATDEWTQIADLPDALGGVVAAGASTVNNEVYIIGGYHIRDDCSEVSSKAVHRYDPTTDSYEKLTNIPIAIDDHVQVPWRDSLIYVITGWSNSTNVTQVQIYNTTTDQWTMGTPVPNDPQWRVFGASGVMHAATNTIYYLGGASLICNSSSCFGPTNLLRKGVIDDDDPSIITWTSEESDAAIGYRMAATTVDDTPLWIGGSDLTYNFDGVDYNGSGGVDPNGRVTELFVNVVDELIPYEAAAPPVMDLRGIAAVGSRSLIVCGGMLPEQVVTNNTYLIHINTLTNVPKVGPQDVDVLVTPNPTADQLQVRVTSDDVVSATLVLRAVSGDHISTTGLSAGESQVDLTGLCTGMYYYQLVAGGQLIKSGSVVKL